MDAAAARPRPTHACPARVASPGYEVGSVSGSVTSPLDGLETPSDLRRLPEDALQGVADAVRAEMIDAVSVTGGQLGSGLGVVELTVALHHVSTRPTTASSGTSATSATPTRSSPAGATASAPCARAAGCRASPSAPRASTTPSAGRTIRRWWQEIGRPRYPGAKSLTITADGGGSNGVRVRLWKRELQRLADESGLAITVHHLPPGTSKGNAIEHRLFAFISQNWRATPLVSYRVIVDLIGATTTRTGLSVRCELDPNRYPKGVTVSDADMAGNVTSRPMRSTASGTTPSHRDRQIKLLFPGRPLVPAHTFRANPEKGPSTVHPVHGHREQLLHLRDATYPRLLVNRNRMKLRD